MNIALIKNGRVENIIVADLEFASQLGYDQVVEADGLTIGIGWVKQGDIFVDPNASDNSNTVEATPILTPLEFLNRFTDEEAKTIMALSKTNPDVELWWTKYNKATFINLADPQTIAGLQALEYATVIGPGRANEILNI